MGFAPFLIANTRVGLERDIEPWLLPEDAYPDLEDCYLWRGRVRKRLGYNLLGRLGRQIGTTDGSGNITVTLPNVPLTSTLSSFVIGADSFQDPGGTSPVTLLTNGAATTHTLNRSSGVLTITGSHATTAVIYYPGLPVMGLRSLESTTINLETLIGFDTSFSYLFNTSANAFSDLTFYKISAAPFIWHGTNYQLFWTTNYADAMFATNDVPGIDGSVISAISMASSAVITVAAGTNFAIGDAIFVNEVSGMTQINGLSGLVTNVATNNITVNINSSAFSSYTSGGFLFNLTRSTTTGDGIKWLDQDQSGWVNFQPPLNGSGPSTNYLQTALLIIPYKGRLLAFNTMEGTSTGVANHFAQRVRWCQNGSPYYATPVPTNYQGGAQPLSWRDDIIGNGGFIDASTLEEIVSVGFVKDTVVVYFERSTWQLRYTGNELLPFIWEKINTELGAESTFSVVPFDQATIAVGNVGIHACDSVNVVRVDQRIPDEVFGIQNENQGTERVYGVRDYFNQLVYWSVPYIGNEPPPLQGLVFPNKILVYNYVDQSYSYFNDSFTCFGYYQAANDLLWGSAQTTWEEATFNWISPQNQVAFPNIVGGNQVGFVEVLMQDAFNQDSLFIAQITPGSPLTTLVIPNHNLTTGSNNLDLISFIKITSATGITGLTGNIYKVNSITDANTITIATPVQPTGTFTGPGTITVVNNISILTKRFNPFISEAAQVRLGYIDFYVNKTTAGQFSVNLYINEDSTTAVNVNLANLSSNFLNTFPESTYAASPDTNLVNSKLWKRMYFQNVSQLFQLQITLSDEEMMTQEIVESDIVLHGMMLWFSKSGRLINV